MAKQQLDDDVVVEEAAVEAELGATMGTQLKRLFSNLGLGQAQAHAHVGKPGASSGRGGGAKGGGAREIKIEDEIVAWVASRVAPATLGQLMCVT